MATFEFLSPFSSPIKHLASVTTPKMFLSPTPQNHSSAQQWKSRPWKARLVGRGPWGLIGGRYFPVTCPCKSQLHLNLDSTTSHFRVVLSEPPQRLDTTHLVPFTRQRNASKARPHLSNLSGPVWSCQRQSQVRHVLHRQIQQNSLDNMPPASDSRSSPGHFQSCRHHITCSPCLPYPPPSCCPPPPVPESRFCRLLDP